MQIFHSSEMREHDARSGKIIKTETKTKEKRNETKRNEMQNKRVPNVSRYLTWSAILLPYMDWPMDPKPSRSYGYGRWGNGTNWYGPAAAAAAAAAAAWLWW